jgi:predicted esterase
MRTRTFAGLIAILLVVAVSGARELPGDSWKVSLPKGKKLTVITETPQGTAKDGWRLCLLMPPGPGTKQMADAAMASIGRDFLKRKWAVAIPVSPDKRPFFGKNAALIPDLIKALLKDKSIKEGKVLIAGISNGGIAAIDIASRNTDLFLGIIAVPGLLIRTTKVKNLKDMPVYLRIGAKDELRWAQSYPSTKEALEKAGAKLDAKLLPGAAHVFEINWKDLDKWLAETTGEKKADKKTGKKTGNQPNL